MRILAIAYACEPDVGSEPGAGWAWSRMLARSRRNMGRDKGKQPAGDRGVPPFATPRVTDQDSST